MADTTPARSAPPRAGTDPRDTTAKKIISQDQFQPSAPSTPAKKGAKQGQGPAPAAFHSVFIVIAIELLAVGAFTLLAGISNEVGKVMVIIMVGFWAIYLVTTSGVISNLGSALDKVAQSSLPSGGK